ncbi:hypothetical protein [Metasolibacillus meyeri]|uniref:hypothetical protein n=1 Tax=Metasolibacillus meyeri TaxID=1071052 RepID=UPI00187D3A7C|nr:hypothetical protein [Metasolibacillus meyeri]
MNIIHAIEQMQAMLRDISPLLWEYKQDLKKQGFTEQQAFDLVRDYQKIMFTQDDNQ